MESSQQGSSGVKLITRNELYNIMQQKKGCNIDEKLEHMKNILLNRENYSDEERNVIINTIKGFKKRLKEKWAAAHRNHECFIKQNKKWLQGSVELPVVTNRPEWPQKTFSELCHIGKRRKIEEARSTSNTHEITFLAESKLHELGQRNASKALENIVSSPTRATKYREECCDTMLGKIKKLSPEEALSMFVEAGLSRKSYNVIRSSIPELYPRYTHLQRAKKDCYPPSQSYTITATSAEVNLQDLMDHTAMRLLNTIIEATENLSETDRLTLELISKWGCDGSQQTQCRMKFENTSDSDTNIFQSSMVPLRLVYGKDKKILWQNPIPSSPRYCRPIRIRFVKESTDITRAETDYVEEKVRLLLPTTLNERKPICVRHTMISTMVDAKVCHAITNTTSTMRCYICGATSKEFNNLTSKNEVDTSALRFGLSILHAQIRLFETLLHLSYKIDVKKWQIRTDTEKDIVKQRKLKIQEDFRNRMGIIVDVPKQGFGNTNDGNTSRRFFSDPELSATITGLDLKLICRIKVILEVISSGREIDAHKFNVYAMDTAKLYVELYPWHPMTPTMHKILIHGSLVIQHALVPIGQLSEKAAEARNKHLRLYHENFSRKISRESCSTNVINRLLLTSDPFIISLRRTPQRSRTRFSAEAEQLLQSAASTTFSIENDDDEDDEAEDYE